MTALATESPLVPTPEPVVYCAACEVNRASFILPSGAPACGDCYLALASPEATHFTTKESNDGR